MCVDCTGEDYDDQEPCSHECDEDCEDLQGFNRCTHQHCWNCGGCGCPGYCDDYQTYNLRPAETGGQPAAVADGDRLDVFDIDGDHAFTLIKRPGAS